MEDLDHDIAIIRTWAAATAIVENRSEFHHGREVKPLSHRMKRREFLLGSSRAALSLSLLPLVPCSQGTQLFARLKDRAPWETLIADLEKQIPRLMEESS